MPIGGYHISAPLLHFPCLVFCILRLTGSKRDVPFPALISAEIRTFIPLPPSPSLLSPDLRCPAGPKHLEYFVQ